MDIKPPSAPSANAQTTQNQSVSSASNLLQAGIQTQITTATVLSSAPSPQTAPQARTLFDVVLNAQGRQIQTQSNHAFQPGQVLKIQIQNEANIRVLQVLANLPLQNSNIIQQGLRQTLPLQQPQNLLLNNLQQFLTLLTQQQGSQTNKFLLAQAQTQTNKLLSLQPRLEQLRNPAALRQAISSNGALLEGKLQQVVQKLSQLTTAQTKQSVSNTPVQSIREALQQNAPLARQAEQLLARDSKAQTLKLAQALAPLLPQQPSTTSTTNSAEAQLVNRILQALIPGQTKATSQSSQSLFLPNIPITTQLHHLTPPQNTSAQQARAGRESFDLAVSTLLRQLAASIARVQTTQLTSLSGQQPTADATALTTWHMEIPVFTEGQFRPIQLHIEEEKQRDDSSENQTGRQWKITMGFDFEQLGEFYATLTIVGDSISTTFWSERANTLKHIQKELDVLQASLQKLGLHVKQLDCRKGTPPLKQSRLDQQLVDIKT